MTPDELRDWMTLHGWSVRRLAQSLGVEPSTVQRWRSGDRRIPPYLPMALSAL